MNYDPETGIRYGVICCNDVDPDFIDKIIREGRDLDLEDLVVQLKADLAAVFDNYGIEADLDVIIEDLELEVESTRWEYESEGMVVMIDSDNDLWILKSPEIGRRGLCSPCAPGACHLKTPGNYECYILPEELMNA